MKADKPKMPKGASGNVNMLNKLFGQAKKKVTGGMKPTMPPAKKKAMKMPKKMY